MTVALPVAGANKAFTLPGRTGARAVELLGDVVDHGIRTLQATTESAIERAVRSGAAPTSRLFTAAELGRLIAAFSASTAAAELLGRTATIRRAERAIEAGEVPRPRPVRFSAAVVAPQFAVYERFAAAVPPRPPRSAIQYFLSLVPQLGIDPDRFGPQMERHAFTLAAATEESMLAKVQKSLALHLAGGKQKDPEGRGFTPLRGPELIQQVLDDAGVSPRNPQYAEMAFRTNVLDSYHAGMDRQLATPDMQELFPVWEYLGIRDGRQGKDHEPKFGKFYPGSASFSSVRGDRPWNCRCSKRPLTRRKWERLQESGAAMETSW